ncbi:class I adenylate-forming enzyme family protein [Mesorhizobium sp. CAU 1732]|uniref:class I adenylate-forming enzyme family protein n=1 Tax=Mesorhizobium sp. CAU 1732 TaxID=3140358 RepID=UPI0032610294
MNLADGIEINARARPDHPAIVAGAVTLSYAELTDRVRATSARFQSFGIRAGDVVGVCLKDTPDHLIANYALARMGSVILPMDWRWTDAEKITVAGHFAAKLVVVEIDAAPMGATPVRTLDALPDAPAEHVDLDPMQGTNLPLLLSLSSGTTGRPKGPCITHQQMLRRFWTHWINLGLNSTDRYVSATPLYFGGGRTFAMSILFAGGTVILFPPPFDSAALAGELERADATSTFLVPTQLRKLLDASEAEKAAMRRLRLLISSGAPLDPDEKAAIAATLNDNFVEYYASTEGGGISLATPETRIVSPNSVGRPVFGVEVQVVSDDHDPLEPGTVGLLRYRGPGVAQGYFGEQEVDESPFRDGWFYPGDIAEIDAGGYVTLRGRRKDMIIRGGVNIYPPEIEQVLREHEDVEEAAVVGRPSQRLGEDVVAFVVARQSVDGEALKSWCATRLAPYKVPESVIFVDDLPRNSAGKVLKPALQATFEKD